MDWELPDSGTLWQAIDMYLARAYPSGSPPSAVRGRLESVKGAPADSVFELASFERDSKESPTRLSLRLGNAWYPHMKLVVQKSPAGKGFLFRADAHDRHIRPAPGSPEADAFSKLMEDNQRLVESIESAWTEAKLPTFKQFLREDLARRKEVN